MAVLSVMPKMRTRWTGSAVCRASSRMRSCRSRVLRVDTERLEHAPPDHGGADQAGIGCGLLADQQVRWLRLPGQALVPVAQPLAGQGSGDLIEVDHPTLKTSPQRDDAVLDHRAVAGVDRVQYVLAGHLAQRGMLKLRPSGEHGHQDPQRPRRSPGGLVAREGCAPLKLSRSRCAAPVSAGSGRSRA